MRSRAVRPIIMVGLGASVFAAVTNFQTVYAEDHGLDYSQYFPGLHCHGHRLPCAVRRIRGRSGAISRDRGPAGDHGGQRGLLCRLHRQHRILYPGCDLVRHRLRRVLSDRQGNGRQRCKAGTDKPKRYRYLGSPISSACFGFPFVAGWIITTNGIVLLLVVAVVLSMVECALAAHRYFGDRRPAMTDLVE